MPADWLQQLRNRIFSGNQYLQRLEAVDVEKLPGIPGRWIVSRGACAFFSVDLGRVDGHRRDLAIEHQVELHSPFRISGFWATWQGDEAKVWVWDREQQEARMQSSLLEGDSLASLDVVPESAFSELREDGLYLLRSLDGYIGQHWHEGALSDEVFWPAEPDDSQWALFARGAGTSASAPPDEAMAIDLQGAHWPSASSGGAGQRQLELTAVLGLVVLLIATTAYQLSAYGSAWLATRGLETDLFELRQQSLSTIAVRDEAYRLHDLNRRLQDLEAMRQLELMNRVARVLPENAGSIMSWEFNRDGLVFLLKQPAAELETYAAALDQLPELESIRLDPKDQAGVLEISARVVGR